uniref:Uncharacterized protein n=1 Tax=Oryza nivara TaxID=4536 RepID=A0A0E0H945_ORYNI
MRSPERRMDGGARRRRENRGGVEIQEPLKTNTKSMALAAALDGGPAARLRLAEPNLRARWMLCLVAACC